jgi:hypothetical protein
MAYSMKSCSTAMYEDGYAEMIGGRIRRVSYPYYRNVDW